MKLSYISLITVALAASTIAINPNRPHLPLPVLHDGYTDAQYDAYHRQYPLNHQGANLHGSRPAPRPHGYQPYPHLPAHGASRSGAAYHQPLDAPHYQGAQPHEAQPPHPPGPHPQAGHYDPRGYVPGAHQANPVPLHQSNHTHGLALGAIETALRATNDALGVAWNRKWGNAERMHNYNKIWLSHWHPIHEKGKRGEPSTMSVHDVSKNASRARKITEAARQTIHERKIDVRHTDSRLRQSQEEVERLSR